jgi:hypothetical protein
MNVLAIAKCSRKGVICNKKYKYHSERIKISIFYSNGNNITIQHPNYLMKKDGSCDNRYLLPNSKNNKVNEEKMNQLLNSK